MPPHERHHRERERRDQDDDFLDPRLLRLHSPSATDVERASRWLERLLASGPLYLFEIKSKAEAAHIPESLLRAAKTSLGVRSINVNTTNELAEWKCWFWELPPRRRPSPSVFDK
jgi:hypothetical protein